MVYKSGIEEVLDQPSQLGTIRKPTFKGVVMIQKGIIAFLSVLAISSCSESSEETIEREIREKDTYNRCVSLGVQYFKEIGSYPTLKSAPNAGRHAIEVARERCEKAPETAFR